MNNPEIIIKKAPFKHFCMSIGAIPTSYLDSLDYYETLLWLIKYLEETIIPTVNNNGEAVKELQTLYIQLKDFVDNYFDNLDVQNEINNKLDEMIENGTMSELLNSIVNDLFITDINPVIDSQNNSINNIQNQVNAIASGSPLVASSTSGMIDTTRVYVNTTDGKWYYYDGDSWEIGGTYQSTGIADGSITEKMLSNNVINNFSLYSLTQNLTGTKRKGTINNLLSLNSCIIFPTKFIPKGSIIEFIGDMTQYRFSVIEMGANHLNTSTESTFTTSMYIKNTSWITDVNKYETSFNGYVCLCYGKPSSSYEITDDELNNIGNLFQIKIPNESHNNYDNSINNVNFGKSIINDFYSSRMGTKTNINATNAINLIIDNKIPKGSIIKVKQPENSEKTYRYAVIEGTDTYANQETTIIDSGYFTSGEYITTSDAYLFLTLNSQNVTNLDDDDKAFVYNAFEIIPNSEYNKIRDGYNNSSLIKLNDNVKGINHRGYNSIAPENTIPAFQLSRKIGFEYVETDVQFTSDNIPVCLHDTSIDRTSNGSGNIADLTYQEVRQFDFGSWKSVAYTGTKIPSFEEFILLCRNIGLKAYVEIKNNVTYTENQIKMLVDIVKKYNMLNKVTWISFNNTYLEYIKNYNNKLRLGLLAGSITSSVITNAINLKSNNNEIFLNINHQYLTNDMVNLAITNNLPLEIYTTDSINNINNFNGYISGMTSNTLIAGNILYNSNI